MSAPRQITQILARIRAGEFTPADELLPVVYAELRALARAMMRTPGTLQPTALVHEAFLRLVGDADSGWQGRGHFFAAAALAMRRILVEQARRRERRGPRARLDDEPWIAAPDHRVLDIDAALSRLQERSPRQVEVVQLRYFAGLSVAEAAEVLGVSIGTVERDWRLARAMLQRELDRSGTGDGGTGSAPPAAKPTPND